MARYRVLILLFLGMSSVWSCRSKHTSFTEGSSITLERTACYGTCPIFELKLTGNGNAILHNIRFVEPLGTLKAQFDMKEWGSLFEEFAKTDWTQFEDEYPASVSDLPAAILTWKHQGSEKTIVIEGKHPAELDVLMEKVEKARTALNWALPAN